MLSRECREDTPWHIRFCCECVESAIQPVVSKDSEASRSEVHANEGIVEGMSNVQKGVSCACRSGQSSEGNGIDGSNGNTQPYPRRANCIPSDQAHLELGRTLLTSAGVRVRSKSVQSAYTEPTRATRWDCLQTLPPDAQVVCQCAELPLDVGRQAGLQMHLRTTAYYCCTLHRRVPIAAVTGSSTDRHVKTSCTLARKGLSVLFVACAKGRLQL